MDNRVFNINGRTKEQLQLAVRLLLLDEYGQEQKVSGWYYTKEKGMVLTWYVGDKYKATPFTDRMGNPNDIKYDELVELLFNWLDTESAKNVICEGDDENADHDGSNELGWRLYTEDWGHINEGHSIDHYSIAAFKPAWLWYGK